jgi:signal transduction histidine kinase
MSQSSFGIPHSIFRTVAVLASMAILRAAAAEPIQVAVDGKSLPKEPEHRIPYSAQSIVFTLGDPSRPAADFNRVRYMLQGVDQDWKQHVGSATFTVCFYDDTDTRFGQKIFEMQGASPGANADASKATFTHRHETVIVPEHARTLGVVLSSAGSPASVGVYLVKNVRITRTAADGGRQLVLGESGPIRTNEDLTAKSVWVADGTHRSMARILSLPTPNGSEDTLAIVDDDNAGHAEWRFSQDTLLTSKPGEILSIEWDEVYENSVGERTPVEYSHLAPGRYTFRMQEVDVWGKPIGSENTSTLIVAAPYWESPWFWGGGILVTNLVVALAAYGLVRARTRRQLERTRLLEQERLRIAHDLHDDLGARLTHLSLLSSQAENRVSTPEDRESFEEFSHLTRDLVAALTETVWTVNPKNDHLESLVSFLCRTISSRCKAAGLRCRIDALTMADHRTVPSDVRHHIVLAVKEAVNNVFKHSDASELKARITFESPVLSITIADDGRGMEPDAQTEGNGLANMRERMTAVNGLVTFQRNVVRGTTIQFEVPIP